LAAVDQHPGRSEHPVVYWVIVSLLIAFGYADLVAIGAPILVLGLGLAVLGPFRRRASVFWPGIVGVLAFIVSFLLLAPLGCTPPIYSSVGSGRVKIIGNRVCSNLVGFRYFGGRNFNYEPSLLPAALIGLALGVLVGAAMLLAIRMANPRARNPTRFLHRTLRTDG